MTTTVRDVQCWLEKAAGCRRSREQRRLLGEAYAAAKEAGISDDEVHTRYGFALAKARPELQGHGAVPTLPGERR